MSAGLRARLAVASLVAIILISASWWMLALWPMAGDTPDWILRTREVCFGSSRDSLPSASGWMVLVGQPLGMILLLGVIAGEDLRAGLRLVLSGFAGQVAAGAIAGALLVGAGGVVARVQGAAGEPFDIGAAGTTAPLTRVDDPAPRFGLTDQSGEEVTLESFRGRPVIVTFAFGHCETVCPVVVEDVLDARRVLQDVDPAVLVITLDPWRDTPSRLPAIARAWRVDAGVRVLSGEPETVERTLNAWRVPRVRNATTGAIAHPSVVYVIDRNGRIAYVVSGDARTIVAALSAL